MNEAKQSETWTVDPYDADPAIRLDGGTVVVPRVFGTVDTARLIAASVNSYRKHCGSRAIECAESDLLGDLIEACKAVRDALSSEAIDGNILWITPPYQLPGVHESAIERLDNAIAKAEREQTEEA